MRRDTSRSLLATLAAGDDTPRTELEARYRPVLQSFARRVGLEERVVTAASDAALVGLWTDVRRAPFDPSVEPRERLFAQARDHIAEKSLTASDVLQTEEAMRKAWELEWRQGLVRFALQSLSQAEDTDARALQAFELHDIEKRSAAEVAKELHMTPTAVFAAKNQVRAKLEALVQQLESAF